MDRAYLKTKATAWRCRINGLSKDKKGNLWMAHKTATLYILWMDEMKVCFHAHLFFFCNPSGSYKAPFPDHLGNGFITYIHTPFSWAQESQQKVTVGLPTLKNAGIIIQPELPSNWSWAKFLEFPVFTSQIFETGFRLLVAFLFPLYQLSGHQNSNYLKHDFKNSASKISYL